MSWQKCPVCEGQGYVFNIGDCTAITSQCDVCRGAKIIDEATGLPPIYVTLNDNEQIINELNEPGN